MYIYTHNFRKFNILYILFFSLSTLTTSLHSFLYLSFSHVELYKTEEKKYTQS